MPSASGSAKPDSLSGEAPDGVPSTAEAALETLDRHFGFREFRHGQLPVVEALAEGRDALVVMPTGGGKSLCYQLPALMLDGVTLVVSPLIALMKDQVDALERRGIPATVINSTLSLPEQRDRLRQMREGAYKLVYIAPERFRSEAFCQSLREVPVALLAIDEAHCLSQWGHDFRPDYLRLGQARQAMGNPQTAGFTATATPEVRRDIIEILGLSDPFITVTGFSRPNLSFRVTQCDNHAQKYQRLEALVEEHGTGIVYCATRKRVEEVSDSLTSLGVKLVAYHGGMDDREREEAQNAFLNRKRDVAVATNAFGMGIDRSDVRFVAHFDVPGSPEAYYQEAGRAGRDGEPGFCELLFNYADTSTQEFFIEGANPPPSLIRHVYDILRAHATDGVALVPIRDLAASVGAKNDMGVSSALSILGRHGHIMRFDVAGERTRGTRLLRPEVSGARLELDEAALMEKSRRDHAKLESMVKYAYGAGCRQEWMLHYFGEEESSPCGTCDQCAGRHSGSLRSLTESELLLVQKALAGVARASRRTSTGWEPRFGKGKIVQMLTGSQASEVISAGLDQLSTYGILKAEGTAFVYALLNELEKSGLLLTERGAYPLVALTSRGAEAMRGGRDFRMHWPETAPAAHPAKTRKGKSSKTPVVLREVGFDAALFEKMRALRLRLAKEQGNLPAFAIFTDKTLESLTRLRPQTIEQGLTIPGIGTAKAERFLAPFLELIREH
ncbi:MAG: RecQ family ATP-dependent DNA helicase [Verrucomicrobiales bacterium]|nr:ATP-dependent DNA helicase RecQ [Verrucomicrobiae bacterium]MCP5554577.1 ATP-dependent DNA helicase RecQ [Akkermansiaceae bacterium]